MSRYVEKSGVIDAVQWDGTTNTDGYPEWLLSAIKNKDVFFRKKKGIQEMVVWGEDGCEESMSPGDFIIRKHNGDFTCHSEHLYPFSKVYEPVQV